MLADCCLNFLSNALLPLLLLLLLLLRLRSATDGNYILSATATATFIESKIFVEHTKGNARKGEKQSRV